MQHEQLTNSMKHRKYVEDVLKEELRNMYVEIPGFFEAFFSEIASLHLAVQTVYERYKAMGNPLYVEGRGWQGWPEGAKGMFCARSQSLQASF